MKILKLLNETFDLTVLKVLRIIIALFMGLRTYVKQCLNRQKKYIKVITVCLFPRLLESDIILADTGSWNNINTLFQVHDVETTSH